MRERTRLLLWMPLLLTWHAVGRLIAPLVELVFPGRPLEEYRGMLRHLGVDDRAEVRYLRMLLPMPLGGRPVLDVGGGSGVVSFYAASMGANPVVCLEPAAAGSNPKMDDTFRRFAGLGLDVDLVREPLDEYTGGRFHVVVLNNVVNHLDEEACARLPDDEDARLAYRRMFGRLRDLTEPGGYLVVADAGRRNLWADLGRRSPFAPTIEWRIHAQPHVWAELAVEAGFKDAKVRWNTHRRLGPLGQLLLGNRVGGYLTNSHFILTLRG